MTQPPTDAGTFSEALKALDAIYADLDAQTAQLTARHRERLHCGRGCRACCVDELSVFEIEARRIRTSHARLLREGTPHPPGACAFLDAAGECRIYGDRPYVCRTQGLPLRWLEETHDGDIAEHRAICELNTDGRPLDALPEDACWLIGPVEQRLSDLQHEIDGGSPRRVPLRALFLS